MAIQISDRLKVDFEDDQNLQDTLTPQEYGDLALTVARKAITGMSLPNLPIGQYGKIAAGTALFGSELILTIAGIAYRLRFRLITTRAIAAAEVFNEAIQWLDAMSGTGRMDVEVASITRSHLISELRRINRS